MKKWEPEQNEGNGQEEWFVIDYSRRKLFPSASKSHVVDTRLSARYGVEVKILAIAGTLE